MNFVNSFVEMVNVDEVNNTPDEDGPSTSWLFSMDRLKNTPSRQAKVSEKEESKKRRESIKMIRDIGSEMKL